MLFESANKDLPGTRVYDVPNGRKVSMVRDSQYGFWTLHLDRGQMPEEFRGAYTSPVEAEKAIEVYKRLKKAD